MRRRTVCYEVFDHNGIMVLRTDNEQAARNQAIARQGTYRSSWIDAEGVN